MSIPRSVPGGNIRGNVKRPGDPGRCASIAAYFDDAKLIAQNREYTTYTGSLLGVPASVCSTGIGGPSAAIAMEELHNVGADTFIRVGTCGGVTDKVQLRDTIIVNSACSDSCLLNQRFGNLHYAPTSDFSLVRAADKIATDMGIRYQVGSVTSSDFFYDKNENWKKWAEYGVLGIEMESAELLTLAAEYKRRAMAIMTVSDHILLGGATSAEERQTTFTNMMKLALETIVATSK